MLTIRVKPPAGPSGRSITVTQVCHTGMKFTADVVPADARIGHQRLPQGRRFHPLEGCLQVWRWRPHMCSRCTLIAEKWRAVV